MDHRPKFWSPFLALLVVLTLLAACGTDKSETGEDDTNTNPSPEQQANVPEGVDELEIAIEGGKIDTDTLNLQQDQPAMMHVDNKDAEAYSIQIVPNLVAPSNVAASGITDVSFTTSVAGEYTLELRMADDSGDPLDTVQVKVQSPSGET
jgi:major membrane immunogen (membrane-anchored lipoprotein)